jgi:hypothetical protein
MKPTLRFIAFLAFGVVLSGCGSLHVNKTVVQSGLPTVDASKVTVVENLEEVSGEYQVVGKATFYRKAGGVSKDGMIKELRKMAGANGADGLIGLHGTTSFRTMLMVRWLNAGEFPKATSPPFVVAVLPIKYDPTVPGDNLEIAKTVRDAIWPMEMKGYYVIPGTVNGFAGGLEEALSLSNEKLEALGGRNSQLLLETRFVKHAEEKGGPTRYFFLTVHFRLLDKQTRKVVFEANGEGKVGGFLKYTVTPNAVYEADFRWVQAAVQGTWTALNDLQPVASSESK